MSHGSAFTTYNNNFSLSLMHGSILPVTIPPPGQPPGQVQPFGPGGGELFETVLSRGWGGGGGRDKSKITSRFSCEARH